MKLQKDTREEVSEGAIKLALLDESTSNISLDVEELFYKECVQNGLTFVSDCSSIFALNRSVSTNVYK